MQYFNFKIKEIIHVIREINTYITDREHALYTI